MLDFNDKQTRCLVVAYYLSRINNKAVSALGYASFREAFVSIGNILNENPNTIKNMRDQFDPFFDNGRVGWYQRELSPSRKKVFDYCKLLSDSELERQVKIIMGMSSVNSDTSSTLLQNLKKMIHQTTVHYKENFVFTDVHLTEEFKHLYSDVLKSSNYEIEFYDSTAIITTPTYKNIFLPDQWFVIAAYGVGVFTELHKYKKYLEKVSSYNKFKFDGYIKKLRDNHTSDDKYTFDSAADTIFKELCSDSEERIRMINYLWRFATDYSWWSGQKTVDRGDFYYSVILNMLNLVNASQGYVSDIVSVYANNEKLRELVKQLDSFTTNLEGITYDISIKDDEPVIDTKVESQQECTVTSLKTRIKVSSESLKKLGGK